MNGRQCSAAAYQRGSRRIVSGDQLMLPQFVDLLRVEPEVAEDFIGMLPEGRRMPPQLRLSPRVSRRRSYRADPSGLRMFILDEGLICSELVIFPDRVEI